MQVGLTTASARTARRAADRDAGAQAGRGRLDDLGHGAAVRPRPRSGLPHPVLPGVRSRPTTPTSRRPASGASRTGSTSGSPATARTSSPAPTSRCPTAATSGSTRPRGATDLAALVKAAAVQVLPDAKLTAYEQRAVPADDARLVTTLTRHPGGATVQVHARIAESFTLVYDAIVTRGGQATALPTAVGAGAAVSEVATAAQAPVVEEERGRRRDPERQPHCRCGSRRGLRQVVARVGRDHRDAARHDRRQRHGLRARGPAVGGAAHRAGPRLADGRADQEPRRVRLRPAADPADRGARRQPVRRREADPVRDRAPRRGPGARRGPEDADRRGDRRRAGRADGRGDDGGRARGDARQEGGRVAEADEPAIPPPPTSPRAARPRRHRRPTRPGRRPRPNRRRTWPARRRCSTSRRSPRR